MPPKRSRSAAAAHASGGGGGPLTPDPSPSPKRVKASAGSLGGTQRKLEAYFTSPKKPKSQSAGGAGTGAAVQRRHNTRHIEQPEVIVIDDDQGDHQDSIRLPSQHSNERRPAAGNATDCGAGPVIIPATPMEGVRLGVRRKDENRGRGIERENDMDTDMLFASRLARAEGGIDIELAKRLELDSTFRTGINSLDGLGPPSNASPNPDRERNGSLNTSISISSPCPGPGPGPNVRVLDRRRREPIVPQVPPGFEPARFPDLAVDPLLFRPYTEPEAGSQTWWPANAPAPYAFLAHTLQTLTSTRSRIAINSTLTNALRVLITHNPPSVLPALYLLSNCLGPPWEGIELGVGGSILSKTLQQTTSLAPTALRNLYKQYGDPGDVAYHAVVGTVSSLSTAATSPPKTRTSVLKPHPRLLIKPLYEDLLKVARASGQGSQKIRQTIIERLILCAVGAGWSTQQGKGKDVNEHLRGEEARFLVRTLAQNLRVGAVRTTILSALARASALSSNHPQIIGEPPGAADLFVTEAELQVIRQRCAVPVARKGARKKTNGGEDDRNDGEALRTQVAQRLLQAEALLKRVYSQHSSYDDIVAVILSKGLDGLRTTIKPDSVWGLPGVGLTLGTPLLPTLGSPMRSLDDVYERLGSAANWTAEMKYDGQRAQVHAWRERSDVEVKVKIFSRHLEDMTDKYPDIINLFHLAFEKDSTISSVIVDSEVVAVDYQTGELRSFQELAGRARRDVKAADVKVAVCLYLFDIMLLNDQILIQQPFRERRRLLRSTLPPLDPASMVYDDDKVISNLGAAALLHARMDHVESVENSAGREAVEEFWEKAVESKCEGLMIKLLDNTQVSGDADTVTEADPNEEDADEFASPTKARRQGDFNGPHLKSHKKPLPATYEPDKRTSAWLKLKKDYVDGVGDSLDLVPLGAWHGMGRKAAWWSPILLGVWDGHREKFVAICKCMSGFTDAFYKALNERYAVGSETCTNTSQWNVDTGGYHPSVYFKPSEVWEIRGADLTISPTSVAAQGYVPKDRSKGISLRFPRFIRVREDKGIHDASDPSFIAKLWQAQEQKGCQEHKGADDGELLDYVEEEDEVEEEDDDL